MPNYLDSSRTELSNQLLYERSIKSNTLIPGGKIIVGNTSSGLPIVEFPDGSRVTWNWTELINQAVSVKSHKELSGGYENLTYPSHITG